MKFTILVAPKSTQHGSRAKLVRKPWPRIIWYSDDEKAMYCDTIIGEVKHLMPKEPWEGPLSVSYDFYFERPKSGPNGKPSMERQRFWAYTGNDLDNLEKGTQDALSKAGLWKNDSQICQKTSAKWYAEDGLFPRIEVTVEKL